MSICTSYLEFEITDDLHRFDLEKVTSWLGSTYWFAGITRERIEHGIRHSSMVVGAFRGADQVGFLRVVSDRLRFAYICDVFVAEPFRKRGIARSMTHFSVQHPDHQGLARWVLTTRDAQPIYSKMGFVPLPNPEKWMVYLPDEAATA